jgi:hypothetical protein
VRRLDSVDDSLGSQHPAGQEVVPRCVVTRLLVETLERLDLRLPPVSFDPTKVRIE